MNIEKIKKISARTVKYCTLTKFGMPCKILALKTRYFVTMSKTEKVSSRTLALSIDFAAKTIALHITL